MRSIRALALALLAAGCGEAGHAGTSPAAPAPPVAATLVAPEAGAIAPTGPTAPFPHANVLLITVDTVRADHLGCYGYARPTTPRLDALAQRSVLFEQAFANSSFTPPAHASILTGLYPAEHGLLHWNKSLAEVPTAAEAFAAAGYATLAVTPLQTLLIVGLKRGFEVSQAPGYTQGGADSIVLAPADAVNSVALSYLLRKGDKRPFFAWVHYYDAHRPYGRQGKEWSGRFTPQDSPAVGENEGWYQLTADAREKLHVDAAKVQLMKDHYDGGLAYLDDRLGQFLDQLQTAGRLDDTIVVVVADHGECFDEHEPEWFAHDPYLYDENVHIPLLVHLPGDAHAGLRVKDLVSQVDLLPTLLELTGVAPLAAQRFSGKSLAPALDGRSLQRAYVFADREGDDLSIRKDGEPVPTEDQIAASRDRLQMLRTPTRKLLVGVDSHTFRLFDLGSAHDEEHDILASDKQGAADAVRAYQTLLESQHPAGNTPLKLDPALQKIMDSLGYTGKGK